MKKKFLDYLKSVGMAEPLFERIEEILGFYQGICPEEIKSIFVTDYSTGDGSRQYESLWFFSTSYCMEAKLFMHSENYDMSLFRNRVDYWNIQKNDYDFEKATEASKLRMNAVLENGTFCDLRASKENCDYLRDVFKKWILPNMTPR